MKGNTWTVWRKDGHVDTDRQCRGLSRTTSSNICMRDRDRTRAMLKRERESEVRQVWEAFM